MNNNVSSSKVQNFQHAHLELDLNKVLFAPDDKGVTQYEIWKDIPDYEGHYQVSNFGRVKSLNRTVKRGNKTMFKHGIIKIQSESKGYKSVLLKKDSKPKRIQTHQLVAMAFLKHIRCGMKRVVDHKNNIKHHNYFWNLQILSSRKNVSKNPRKGTSNYMGVSWNTRHKKWRVLIYFEGKNHHLGFFNDEKKASEHYQKNLDNINKGKPIKIKRKKLTSKYRGIYKTSKKWALKIKGVYYGAFNTEEEALTYRNKILNNENI